MCTGKGGGYLERLRIQIPYLEFGVELTAGLMTTRRQRMHRTELEMDWNWFPVSQTEHLLQEFDASFLKGMS